MLSRENKDMAIGFAVSATILISHSAINVYHNTISQAIDVLSSPEENKQNNYSRDFKP